MEFRHLESNPEILGGKICVKGSRISIDLILEWLSSGATIDDIIQNHPQISREAISEALQYASNLIKNTLELEIKISPAA